jgi:hypothetical protein
MQTILYITAPLIYFLIILFSAWIGIMNGKQRKGINPQIYIAILAGLSTCPLVAVLIQFGRLEIPSVEVFLPLICLTLGIGFFVGLIYIWVADLIKLDSSAVTSLFVLGTIGGSTICLYFYFFFAQVQELLISSAWGFLFGVLLYMVIKGPRNMFNRFSR